MPSEISGVSDEPFGSPVDRERHRSFASADGSIPSAPPPYPLGAGYLLLVARELTGLSQRKLAARVRTTQPSLAKIESGSRIPTVRTLLRVAAAAGYELVLGLIEADADPPLPTELDAFTLLGIVRINPEDDLADFIVLREPSVLEGPAPDAL